jgi:hypothetical protein
MQKNFITWSQAVAQRARHENLQTDPTHTDHQTVGV